MQEPFDPETAAKHVRAILEGPGMTVFTKRVKEDSLKNDMTSLDLVNVLRGGKLSAIASTPGTWRYRSVTRFMAVEFSFRGPKHGASAPSELFIENARRIR